MTRLMERRGVRSRRPEGLIGTDCHRKVARLADESSLTAAVWRRIALMRTWHDMHPLPAAVV
ncbi:MAG: hypothetical protein ABGZ23_29625, partial [Fuerstiella sp.]